MKRVAELESSLVQIRDSIKGLESDAMSLVDCQHKRIAELEARLESEIRSCVSAHERWGKQAKDRDQRIEELEEERNELMSLLAEWFDSHAEVLDGSKAEDLYRRTRDYVGTEDFKGD